LTKALKGDSKMMQNSGANLYWNVFWKKSGLEKDESMKCKSFTTTDGNRFPDVVINLPDGKKNDCRL
jgi:hypothetical protein